MRSEIEQLSKIGTLPPEDSASIELLEKIQTSIQAIKSPITNEEAQILVSLFGPEDSCYGLAWSLVHLIESTPGWPIADCISNPKNEWTRLLRDRVRAGQKNDFKRLASLPNPSFNPDAASASHFPPQAFGFLVSHLPRRFGSAG